MGSFWGPNDTMKEAAGFPREYANWSYQQYKDWLNRQNQFGDRGDWATGTALDYNINRMNGGIGPIDTIKNYGQEIMPGVQEAIDAKKARLQQILADYQALPQTAETMAQIRETQGQLADLVRYTGDANRAEIADTASRAFGREGAANTAIMQDLLTLYPELAKSVATDYGAMRDTNRSVYGGLKDSGEEAYGEALGKVEQLRPGSEFAVARSARSFAPVMAATAGRLRREGLTSSSPQAIALMQRAEAARSRAMDDAAAQGTADYVKAANDLILGRQGTRERLGLGELGNELTLAGQQSGLTRDLSREQGGLTRGETTRHLGAEQSIDRDRSQRAVAENAADYGRTTDYFNTANQNALLERGMGREDWNTQANLLREMSDTDLAALGLTREQFNAGMGYHLTNLAEKNAGAAGVGDYGQQQTNDMFRAGQMAQNFGNTAANNYGVAYQYNAPKAGYGTKLLAAAAPYAASLIPVVGPYIATGLSAGMGGGVPGAGGSGNAPGVTYGSGNPYGTQGGTQQQGGQQANSPYAALDFWKKLNSNIWNQGKGGSSNYDPYANYGTQGRVG